MANIATSGHLLLPVKFRIPNQVHRFFSALQIFAKFWTSIHLEKKIHSPDCSTKSPLCSHCYGSRSLRSGASYFMCNVKFLKGTSALINGITFILSVDLAMFCFILCVLQQARVRTRKGLVAGLMN